MEDETLLCVQHAEEYWLSKDAYSPKEWLSLVEKKLTEKPAEAAKAIIQKSIGDYNEARENITPRFVYSFAISLEGKGSSEGIGALTAKIMELITTIGFDKFVTVATSFEKVTE